MPKPTTTRTRKTKAEVEKELEVIREEAAEEKAATTPRTEKVARIKESETREAVKEVTVEGVVQGLAALGLDVSKALGGVSERLLEQVNLLAAVREAVALERQEIERLHKVDTVATAVDQLLVEWEQHKQRLEADIAGRQAAWAELELQHGREQREYDDNLKRQRQREMDEYEYKKSLERKKGQDRYEEERRSIDKSNLEKQQELEKSWAAREAALASREEELADLTREVEEFPGRLQKEISKAAGEAQKAAEARFEQQLTLLRKDAEAEKRLAELQIRSLEEGAGRQAAQIDSLQRQLDEAKKQVQDIAVRAIEGASGAKALSHINQIAMEQAKQRSPQG